jgi:hypothetical protein
MMSKDFRDILRAFNVHKVKYLDWNRPRERASRVWNANC